MVGLFWKNKYFVLFLVFGLLLFSYPMLVSGFDLMPGDGVDTKFVNYILEHSFLWLSKTKTHEYFWSCPFYFPYKNTLAYSDILLGIIPFYWGFRFLLSPMSSLQALFILMCVLNYSSFYCLSKKFLKFSDLSSSMSAFVFAFSTLRFYKSIHLQFYTQFFTIFALIFLLCIKKENSNLKNHMFFILSFVFLVLEFYSCYSLAHLFCVVFLVFVLSCLFFRDTREIIFDFLKNFWRYILGYGVFALILLLPLGYHYLSIGEVRSLHDIEVYLQNPSIWIWNESILDNFLLPKTKYTLWLFSGDMSASYGILTTIFGLYGISKIKKFNFVFYILCLFVFLSSCKIGSFFFWKYIYHIIPGSEGTRVIMRIAFLGLVVVSFGIGAIVQYFSDMKNKWCKAFLILSILIIFLENISYTKDPKSDWSTFSWSKAVFLEQVEHTTAKIPKDKDKIFINCQFIESIENMGLSRAASLYRLSFAIDILSMWAALSENKYSISGYSGVVRDMKDYSKEKDVFRFSYIFSGKNIDIDRYFLKK